MNSDDRSRVESIVDAARCRTGPERAAYLADACAGSDELRRAVERALEAVTAQTATSDWDLDPAREQTRAAAAMYRSTVPEAAAHPRVVAFDILKRIGAGGMGEVWLAQQHAPLERRVAIKLIKAGIQGQPIVDRFDQERRALARMTHPGIAAVYDAGTTEDGRPYFVMEYVPGSPLPQYCDRHRLSIRERIRLFRSVCEAVQHAHQKGVIHRDLTPRNILVADIDGRPTAKVIDFGIAKAVESVPGLPAAGEGPIGTLQYMSPEQLRGAHDVDTRTDIYSLGVLLYELLTGASPFDWQELKEKLRSLGPSGLSDAVSGSAPPAPSTRLGRLRYEPVLQTQIDESPLATQLPTAPALPAEAANDAPDSADESALKRAARYRNTTPLGLVRGVRGELDWIVQKAIEATPDERYASVSEFSADLARFLGHEPVSVGPRSIKYRVAKFVRRQWLPLSTAAAIFLSIAGGVGAVLQMERAQTAEREVLLENSKRERFQVLFNCITSAERGGDATVRELLEGLSLSLGGIAEADADAASSDAWVHSLVGQQFLTLGQYPAARRHLEAAEAVQRRLHAHADLALTLERRARLEFEERSDIDSTLRAMNEAALLRGKRESSGVETLIVLAGYYFEAGDPVLATLALDRAEAALRAAPDANFEVELLNSRSYLYASIAEQTFAEAGFRSVVAADREAGEDGARYLAVSLNNLAISLAFQGLYEEAALLLDDAEAINRRLWGETSLERASNLGARAFIAWARGDLAAALEHNTDAMAMQQKIVGQEHLAYTFNEVVRAALLRDAGRTTEADETYGAATLRYRRLLGRVHIAAPLVFFHDAALVRLNRGDAAGAEPLLRGAIAAYTELGEPASANLAVARRHLADVLADMNKPNAADEAVLAQAIATRALGAGHPATSLAVLTQIRALGRAGEREKALDLYRAFEDTRSTNRTETGWALGLFEANVLCDLEPASDPAVRGRLVELIQIIESAIGSADQRVRRLRAAIAD